MYLIHRYSHDVYNNIYISFPNGIKAPICLGITIINQTVIETKMNQQNSTSFKIWQMYST